MRDFRMRSRLCRSPSLAEQPWEPAGLGTAGGLAAPSDGYIIAWGPGTTGLKRSRTTTGGARPACHRGRLRSDQVVKVGRFVEVTMSILRLRFTYRGSGVVARLRRSEGIWRQCGHWLRAAARWPRFHRAGTGLANGVRLLKASRTTDVS